MDSSLPFQLNILENFFIEMSPLDSLAPSVQQETSLKKNKAKKYRRWTL